MGELFAGRYELVDPIGRGGTGAVWRAWDYKRRDYVAAKVLRQSDAHALIRFVREQALRIDHPHVLAPRNWAAEDEKVLFTMELVRGGSLAHLIGDYGALPPRYVCALLDQLLSGLSAVHDENVVHRDVKPANILLEDTGTGRPHVRLSDFGIAMRKGEPRLTVADHVVGTPGYFAPEQLDGAEPDFPADLYAVGLVALYLLTGRKPDAEALVQRFTAVGGVPSAPQGVPEPLWEVVATLLRPDPQARFRSATGARKALARALDLLPEPHFDDEPVEVFDQLGPLPAGYGPRGPVQRPGDAPDAGPDDRDAERDAGTGRGDAPSASRDVRPEDRATGTATTGTGTADRTETGYRLAPPRPPVPPLPVTPPTAAAPTANSPVPPPHLAPGPPVAPPVPPRPARAPEASTGNPPGPEDVASPVQDPPTPTPHLPVTPSTAVPLPAALPAVREPGEPAADRGPARGRRAGHAAPRTRRPALGLIVGMYVAAAVFLAVGVWAVSG